MLEEDNAVGDLLADTFSQAPREDQIQWIDGMALRIQNKEVDIVRIPGTGFAFRLVDRRTGQDVPLKNPRFVGITRATRTEHNPPDVTFMFDDDNERGLSFHAQIMKLTPALRDQIPQDKIAILRADKGRPISCRVLGEPSRDGWWIALWILGVFLLTGGMVCLNVKNLARTQRG